MKRILHIDNEPDTLASVKTILEKEGYEVVSISNGKDAIKEIAYDGYSLVLLDIMMPDLSGWDVFTRIMKISPEYKVVFLSVLDVTPERLAELKKHGLAGYITKPFDREVFVKKVADIINS